MKRVLLDTNIVSALIKGRDRDRIRERIAAVGVQRVCTSVIVAVEIRFGLAKNSTRELRKAAIEAFDVLAFEAPADGHYALVRYDLERRGVPIGANDMLIAAHCLALDATLVTHNTGEFARVPGLKVVDWLVP